MSIVTWATEFSFKANLADLRLNRRNRNQRQRRVTTSVQAKEGVSKPRTPPRLAPPEPTQPVTSDSGSGQRRHRVFHWFYIVVAIFTTSIPACAHKVSPHCAAGGVRHWSVFHLDNYCLKWSEQLPPRREDGISVVSAMGSPSGHFDKTTVSVFDHFVPVDNYELWEISALVQSLLVSVLLFIELDDKSPGVKRNMTPLIVTGILSVGAVFCLAVNFITYYEVALIAIILGFMWFDAMSYRRKKAATFKFLMFYVDVPVLSAILVMCFVAGFPITKNWNHFFSGAVAFQLMVANIAIIMIRSHQHIEASNGLWNAWLAAALGGPARTVVR